MTIEEFPNTASTKKEWKPPRAARVPYGYKPKRVPTQPATPEERKIVRRSEDYTNPISIAAGVIIRSAIDIGRYERTLHTQELTKDQGAHVARLIRAASVQATICMNNLAEEAGSPMSFVCEVAARVGKVSWDTVPDAKIPVITSEVPTAGTEYPHHIAFQNQIAAQRVQIPA